MEALRRGVHFGLKFPEKYAVTWSLLIASFEVLLTGIIILKVPYTEIDWATYMQQVSIYQSGERNYSLIKGDTGPLVYPAGFLTIYSGLHNLTDGGKDIRMAQFLFGGLYVVNLLVVHAILRKSKVPPWTFIFLSFSKRLHSIYVLRLFNDPVAMFFLYSSVLALTHDMYSLSSYLVSIALSIKMNILLFLPGYGIYFLLTLGLLPALRQLFLIFLLQVVIGLPFLTTYPGPYLANAFQFSRVFLYKWTVNWRFIPEDIFLDQKFSTSLLIGHIVTLSYFVLRWLEPHGGLWKVIKTSLRHPNLPVARFRLTALDAIELVFISNFIGIVFSRSLHYQFYISNFKNVNYTFSWIIRLTLFGTIEFAWNVFPSTNYSSIFLLVSHLFILFGSIKRTSKNSYTIVKKSVGQE